MVGSRAGRAAPSQLTLPPPSSRSRRRRSSPASCVRSVPSEIDTVGGRIASDCGRHRPASPLAAGWHVRRSSKDHGVKRPAADGAAPRLSRDQESRSDVNRSGAGHGHLYLVENHRRIDANTVAFADSHVGSACIICSTVAMSGTSRMIRLGSSLKVAEQAGSDPQRPRQLLTSGRSEPTVDVIDLVEDQKVSITPLLSHGEKAVRRRCSWVGERIRPVGGSTRVDPQESRRAAASSTTCRRAPSAR